MLCPDCGHDKNLVADSRKMIVDGDPCIWRRRQCRKCGGRFTTYECYELADVEAPFRISSARELARNLLKLLDEK